LLVSLQKIPHGNDKYKAGDAGLYYAQQLWWYTLCSTCAGYPWAV